MGILSGNMIGPENIVPFRKADCQPASYDVHLGSHFKSYTGHMLDLRYPHTLETVEREFSKTGYYLFPGMLLLGSTEEQVICGDYAVQIVALSSLMRIGLQVGQGSWADPGFYGNLTLELSVMSQHPVNLYPGMRIAQLVFHEVIGDITPYAGKYQAQTGAQGAKVA